MKHLRLHPKADAAPVTPRIAPRSRSPPSASPASLARTPRTASSPASPTTPSGASADHLDAALAELEAPGEPLPLLIRATNGKGKEKRHEKILFSTIVQPDEIEGFFTRYAEVCKGGMSGGLRKRDKKGKGKKKTKGREGKEKVGGEERAG